MTDIININRPLQVNVLISEKEAKQGLKACAILVSNGVIPAIRYLQSEAWTLANAVEFLADFECMLDDLVQS